VSILCIDENTFVAIFQFILIRLTICQRDIRRRIMLTRDVSSIQEHAMYCKWRLGNDFDGAFSQLDIFSV
jgi:hypothetical protein